MWLHWTHVWHPLTLTTASHWCLLCNIVMCCYVANSAGVFVGQPISESSGMTTQTLCAMCPFLMRNNWSLNLLWASLSLKPSTQLSNYQGKKYLADIWFTDYKKQSSGIYIGKNTGCEVDGIDVTCMRISAIYLTETHIFKDTESIQKPQWTVCPIPYVLDLDSNTKAIHLRNYRRLRHTLQSSPHGINLSGVSSRRKQPMWLKELSVFLVLTCQIC